MSKFESYTTTVPGRDILTVQLPGNYQAEYVRLNGEVHCVEAAFSGYTKEDMVQIEVFAVADRKEDPQAFAFFERGERPVIPVDQGYWDDDDE
jgi:hypothetical protein